MRKTRPWNKYAVGAPGRRWTDDCVKFQTVSHVAHLNLALRIIEDGMVRRRLVSDESKLNSQRVQTTWLSPNHWNDGFRYGSVRFGFAFEALARGKHAYWVEDMPRYHPTACRILITESDHDSTLERYDPGLQDGPWWHDDESGEHYFNGRFCLEFMFEDDVALAGVTEFGFVKHHPKLCSLHRPASSCPERNLHQARAGGQFFAAAAGQGLDLSFLRRALKRRDDFKREIGPALRELVPRFRRLKFRGPVKAASERGPALARALLNAIAIDEADEMEAIASLFNEEEEMLTAVSALIDVVLRLDDVATVRRAMG